METRRDMSMAGTGRNQLESRMTTDALALMDKGDANRRILSKEEYRADFRRVEAASLKRKTMLKSAEGKRMFARCFYSFQVCVYFISTMGRTKLPHESIEKIEQAIRERLEAATKDLNQAIDGAELLFKQHGIGAAATYDTVPLEVEIGITSALGRRYFEMIHKLDQLMPLLQTLEIEEVISERQVEHQRSKSKRLVLAMASTARNFSAGIRRRMNEVDAEKPAVDVKRASTTPFGSTTTGRGNEIHESIEADMKEPTVPGVANQSTDPSAEIDVGPVAVAESP
jgi:hypothetical protein